MLRVYFGHHKCATTWTNDILRHVAEELGLNHRTVNNTEDFGGNLADFVRKEKVELLAYVNADISHVRDLGEFRGFHVIRDPRDLCVSAYFSHKLTHTECDWLKAHRQALRDLSMEEGLTRSIDFNERFIRNLQTWNYSQQNVLEVKMEALVANSYEEMLEIFAFLEIMDDSPYSIANRVYDSTKRAVTALCPRKLARRIRRTKTRVPAERCLGILWEHRFEKKAGGRPRGHEDLESHYRRGITGEWRECFTDEHVLYFKQKYQSVLEQLDYEKNDEWMRYG